MIKDYKYIPILKVNRSEMTAVKELPNKDKDELLPLFLLKGWMSSNSINSTLDRIIDSFGKRPWIADIDSEFKSRSIKHAKDDSFPRPVFKEFYELLDPKSGFMNWCLFIAQRENLLPCLRLEDLSELSKQLEFFRNIQRQVFVNLKLYELNDKDLSETLDALYKADASDAVFLLDFGDIDSSFEKHLPLYIKIVDRIKDKLETSNIVVSASSFPFSFTGQHLGESSIYERQLFQKVLRDSDVQRVTYSDHGSTRVGKIGGSSGTPPPRIDYPLKFEWKFVREEFEDSSDIQEGEKLRLYRSIAEKITSSDYWLPDLNLWGRQMIERTKKGDEYAIKTPQDATAVRINLHLFQQLHFDKKPEEVDTDEDWIE